MLAIATVYKWFWNFVVHFIVTEMTSLYNINTMTIELHNQPTFSASSIIPTQKRISEQYQIQLLHLLC